MKRTNVIVDEELLEEARVVTGERTYSGAIARALEEIVRRKRFERAFVTFSERVRSDDMFRPGFVEENWPEVAEEYDRALKPKKRSAHEKRVPPSKKKTGRAAR
ncbi:MAG TPA: type II toxin-antitoxin system VapB family antitoxin [Thermoanaerobaculia bacterium]|jgi:hypothetical protein